MITLIQSYKNLLQCIEENALQEDPLIGATYYELKDKIKVLAVMHDWSLPYKCGGSIDVSYNAYTSLRQVLTDRRMSWSDDGRQPEVGEWLLEVCFPTGAYIFGEGYPTKTFNEFFSRLKEYSPKYCDSVNRYLGFSKDSAARVLEDFHSIYEEYRGKVNAEVKAQRVQALKRELKQLGG